MKNIEQYCARVNETETSALLDLGTTIARYRDFVQLRNIGNSSEVEFKKKEILNNLDYAVQRGKNNQNPKV